jgi:hypothetical protein
MEQRPLLPALCVNVNADTQALVRHQQLSRCQIDQSNDDALLCTLSHAVRRPRRNSFSTPGRGLVASYISPA